MGAERKAPDDRLDLSHVARVSWAWRRFIAVNTLAVAVLAAVVSLLVPSQYRAVTSLLPPEEDASAGFVGITALLQRARIPGFRLAGANTTSDLLSAVLESRTVREPIVEEFGLKKLYRAKTMDEALRRLGEKARTSVTDEGIVVLAVTDKDPSRAAAIANRHVDLLDRFNREVRTTRGGRTRDFIGRRIEETRRGLAAAEESLRAYQEGKEAPVLPGSEAAALDAAAQILARKIALEAEVTMLGELLAADAPELREKRLELSALAREIQKLPEVGMELARLYREVRVQEEVYSLLVGQFEEAKIQEARDTPTVQVLDRAVPPEKRSWPKRKLIVLLAAAGALALSVALSLALEERRRPAAP
jgi:uncharacterized protein involved in exopolysaccharide biosynthesis